MIFDLGASSINQPIMQKSGRRVLQDERKASVCLHHQNKLGTIRVELSGNVEHGMNVARETDGQPGLVCIFW